MSASPINRIKSVICPRTGGFTLTELLVAGALTAIVVGISGAGLASMLGTNRDGKAQNERRIELNRSLDFIAAEVRRARTIAPDADLDLGTDAPDFDATGKTPVLTLEVPNVDQRIIYYLADATPPWRGPQIIYRWGPNLNINGAYDNPNDPANWEEDQPLIDLISDEASEPDCESNPGWQANPPEANATGFYTCVSETGKIAKIYHEGQLNKVLGNPELYALETQVFARALQPSDGNRDSGDLVTTELTDASSQSTMTIHNLGGAVQCGRHGSRVDDKISGTLEFTPGPGSGLPAQTVDLPGPGQKVDQLVDPTTELSITVRLDTDCRRNISVNSNDDLDRQVLKRFNGQQVPPFKAYANQNEIEDFLTGNNPENDDKPYLNAETREISLASNQAIFLFELGADFNDSASLENQPSKAFDMQDLVVVATIEPNEEQVESPQ